MKTVADKTTRDELIQRIHLLTGQSAAQWGKMNVYQMLVHCALWQHMMLGKTTFKRIFLGRIIGRLALKKELADAPMARNTPTSPEIKIKETQGDVAAAKNKWIALLEETAQVSNAVIHHPFFGDITSEQAARLMYKHADHHLRQFGV